MTVSWQDIVHVINMVWCQPITTKSDKAREWADALSLCASRGFISTEVAPGLNEHGRYWKVTRLGLDHMGQMLEGCCRETVLETITGEYKRQELDQESQFL